MWRVVKCHFDWKSVNIYNNSLFEITSKGKGVEKRRSCNIRGIIFFSLAKIFSRKVSLTLAVEKRNFTEFACYTCSFLKPLTEWPHRCNHHCHGNTLRNMAQIFLSITDTKASCCRVVFETIGLSEGFWHRSFFLLVYDYRNYKRARCIKAQGSSLWTCKQYSGGGGINLVLLQNQFVQGCFNWPLMYGLRHVGGYNCVALDFKVCFFYSYNFPSPHKSP